MHHVSPITAAEVKPYTGGPIHALLRDGSEVAGYVQGVEGGRLLIGIRPPQAVGKDKAPKTKTSKASASEAAATPVAAAQRKARKQSGARKTNKARAASKPSNQKQASVANSPYPVTMRPGGVIALDLSYVAAFVAERASRT